MPFHSICDSVPKPICDIALGAKPSPIIIIIGPITICGNNLFIQFLPIKWIIVANTTYISPITIIPVIAPEIPPFKYAAASGAINANELPK